MDLEQIYSHFNGSLEEVDRIVCERSSFHTDIIPLVTEYIVKSGGKRFRPLLTILSAELCNITNNRHLKLAAAVEFIHTATLLHDDVIDESMMRRNKPTANNVWGNKAVILVGDYLFSRSFQLMVEDKSLDVLRVLSTASSIISEGEVMQLDEIGNFDLSYDKYIKIISAKTAELFAASCEISPLTADNIDNKLVSVMREIGLYLGIAFQIMDDVIDYSPSPKKGKNQGDDFLEGKVTLPLILLRDKLETPAKTKLYQIFADLDFTKESFAYVYTLIEKYNILEKSVTYAEEYINKARQKLESFPDSYAKEAFEEIFKFSLERNF
ncbi:MAG: hypothetical protein BGO27_01420 [Alphaproteobacteria bacterium 33-17]|nr:MAG: hypothetical protein BGO27_01420 [Alphaproteobacteria bacterium 33-17]